MACINLLSYYTLLFLSMIILHLSGVTFIPSACERNPVQYLITLNKRDKISKLREQLVQLLNKTEVKGLTIVLAEVFDNHIAKMLVGILKCSFFMKVNITFYKF